MTEEVGPDGVMDIVTDMDDDYTIALFEDNQSPFQNIVDEREITFVQRKVIVGANTTSKVLDVREAGDLNHVVIRCGKDSTLPSCATPTGPESLAIELQIDGYIPGGMSPVYDGTLNKSISGVRVSELQDLSLPNGSYTNFTIAKDTPNEIVIVFQPYMPRKYDHRLRLRFTNLHTSTDLIVNYVEVSRRRRLSTEGNSPSVGPSWSHHGM